MSVLEIKDLSIRFGGLQALQDVNITVNEYEIVGLIGPNGAGKTTAFNCITGFYKPTTGTVTYKGRDVTHVPPHKKCAMGFGRTFQNVGMVKSATALENLKTAQHADVRYGALVGIGGSGASFAEEKRLAAKADEILELLELTDVRDTRIGSLSYGTLKLLELGCALATNPEILLLDEPSSGMGPEEAHALGDRLRNLRKELGLTMLLIEHHVPLVLSLCDHVYVLNFGRLLASGEPSLIQTHPEVVAAYMGGEAPDALAATTETAEDAALDASTPHDADALAHAHHTASSPRPRPRVVEPDETAAIPVVRPFYPEPVDDDYDEDEDELVPVPAPVTRLPSPRSHFPARAQPTATARPAPTPGARPAATVAPRQPVASRQPAPAPRPGSAAKPRPVRDLRPTPTVRPATTHGSRPLAPRRPKDSA